MVTTTMKAVRVHRYGGPEVLITEEIARPEPGEGEVLIHNYATSINPADWKLRAGLLREQFEFPLPLIPGWDVTGTVAALGEGVSEFEVGQEEHMNIFLTGATGYVGNAIAEALQQAGHHVTGLARSEAAADLLAARNIKPVIGDVRHPPPLAQQAREADGVVHAAIIRDMPDLFEDIEYGSYRQFVAQ